VDQVFGAGAKRLHERLMVEMDSDDNRMLMSEPYSGAFGCIQIWMGRRQDDKGDILLAKREADFTVALRNSEWLRPDLGRRSTTRSKCCRT
jgi:hypothetical protein